MNLFLRIVVSFFAALALYMLIWEEFEREVEEQEAKENERKSAD